MKLPRPTTPYRAAWLCRLKDLAVLALLALLLGAIQQLAFGAAYCRTDPTTGRHYCIDTRVVQVDDCTAFFIDVDGDSRWVLTSQHSNKAVGERYVVRGPDGSQTLGTVVAIGASGADCALLRTDQPGDGGLTLAKFEPPLGATLKLFGYPLGGPLTAKQLRPYSYDDPRTAEAHGTPYVGDSGGPVCDAFGHVVGILSGQHGGPAYYCRLGPILAMFAGVSSLSQPAASNAPPFVPPAPPELTQLSKLPPPPVADSQTTTAEQAAKDAQGWTATSATAPLNTLPAVPATSTVIVREVPFLVPAGGPSVYGAAWHADINHRVGQAELAIAAVEKKRDADATATAKSLEAIKLSPPQLPVAQLTVAQLPTPALPAPVAAAAQTIVEKVERTGYLEILAQIVLVAGGSVGVIGTGYGAWIVAGKAAIKFARWVLRNHFAGQSTASTTPTATAPTMQRYEFDSVLKQSVPVGSPKPAPVVVQTPPTVTQSPADVRYVPIDTDLHAKAHAWASEHTARIYGDRRATAAEIQSTHDALIKQYLASQRI
ncbi:MAG: serine protease [Pirellulales bacterium]